MNNELRERIAGLLITHPSGLRAVGDPPDWPWAVADAILAMPDIAVVELPEPFPIEVTEIDMCPEDDDGNRDPRMVLRFSGSHRPGQLFDRRNLAAALLAAAEYAEEETK